MKVFIFLEHPSYMLYVKLPFRVTLYELLLAVLFTIQTNNGLLETKKNLALFSLHLQKTSFQLGNTILAKSKTLIIVTADANFFLYIYNYYHYYLPSRRFT